MLTGKSLLLSTLTSQVRALLRISKQLPYENLFEHIQLNSCRLVH